MKKILPVVMSLIAIVAAVSCIPVTAHFKPVAVIELFTSQGCSSCPPADRLLGETIGNAKKDGKNIIALSFHVDYWNRLGWADPFSDKEYSRRQEAYVAALHLQSAYTPQMIVNGSREFVGSSQGDLKDALNTALNTPPLAGFKSLNAILQNGHPPQIKFTLDGDYAGCKINAALVSLSEITSIKRGENGGLTLRNENVVRQFISIPAAANGELSFKNMPVPPNGNMAIVAYIQRIKD